MITIIQPTTHERNLSGVCYMPYWVYSMCRKKGAEVRIVEDATLRTVDAVLDDSGRSDTILIDVSSYPQLDIALSIARDRRDRRVRFIGYEPVIRAYKLPFFAIKEDDLLRGVFSYPRYFSYFSTGLLSDCDGHLKDVDDTRPIVPVFMGIGCRRRCPYCYVGYSNYPFGHMSESECVEMLEYLDSNYYNVHFCDENFFAHPHIAAIIKKLRTCSIKYIALTDTITLSNVIERIGEGALIESGCELCEVGIETADSRVLSKRQAVDRLLNTKIPIFWLTVTFLPDETISSLNKTGEFLREYGHEYDDVVPRLRTNSTVGGLGQFFQLYHGTPWHARRDWLGITLTDRPTRLWPSFVGHKFLAETPHSIYTDIPHSDEKWFELYGLTRREVDEVWAEIDGKKNVLEIWGKGSVRRLIVIAQLARLGRISA